MRNEKQKNFNDERDECQQTEDDVDDEAEGKVMWI